MANRSFKRDASTLEAGIVKLWGKVTTSTSGTIASTSCKGFAVTKTGSETGRYTVTLTDRYSSFKHCSVVVQGAADAAYTTGKGLVSFIRGVDMTNKVFYIQFVDADGSPADAELEDSAIFYLEITLKNTAAVY